MERGTGKPVELLKEDVATYLISSRVQVQSRDEDAGVGLFHLDLQKNGNPSISGGLISTCRRSPH
jgi:hypothetical protein